MTNLTSSAFSSAVTSLLTGRPPLCSSSNWLWEAYGISDVCPRFAALSNGWVILYISWSFWGSGKLLGAVALVIPRFPQLKEWAYAGVLFDLTGAVASLSASGLISVGTMAYPIVMICVAVASWALRPPSRRLGSGQLPLKLK